MNNLGLIYDKGLGVEKNDNKAVKCFAIAAKQGYSKSRKNLERLAEKGNSNAQNTLGRMYENGFGVDQDDGIAMHWFEKAAEQGSTISQFNLALNIYKSKSCKPDFKKAYHWYQKAADQGDPDAQNNLGRMIEQGLGGVKKDNKKAFQLYKKAAETGDSIAQFNTGLSLECGRGVKVDLKHACYWYKKSAEQGDLDAKKHLLRIRDLSVKNVKLSGRINTKPITSKHISTKQNKFGFLGAVSNNKLNQTNANFLPKFKLFDTKPEEQQANLSGRFSPVMHRPTPYRPAFAPTPPVRVSPVAMSGKKSKNVENRRLILAHNAI
tara:strand:+ start:1520 stop:2485 length:966 start_codon:yes stop_codon:yes gene_type:complete